jgi:epoxyqueuosine reductase
VLGTLITAAELEPTPPMRAGCGACTRCVDACPTGALDEPGVLDATLCLSYWTQVPGSIPEVYRGPLGSQLYGCDICQDVCPWNRGVEGRRAGLAPDADAHVDLLALLGEEARLDEELLERLYVPRNDPRWLQRNAIVSLGNTASPGTARGEEAVATLEAHAEGLDQVLADHARWALGRIEERCS